MIDFIQWPVWLYQSFPKFNKANAFMDAAVFAVAGDLLRQGGAPYLSYWDHKPPFIHLLNAVGIAMTNGRLWGIWVLSFAALLAALFLCYFTLRSAFGVPAAIVGTTFFVGGLPAVWAPDVTEEYALPLQWAAVFVLARWRESHEKDFHYGSLLGILAALGFLLRPNLIGTMIAVLGVVILLLLIERHFVGLRNFILGVVTAFIGMALIVLLYLSIEGALFDFWDQVFHYNFIYAASNWKLRVRVAYYGLFAATVYVPLLLPLAGLFLALYRFKEAVTNIPSEGFVILALIWLPLELFLDSLAGREYGHYFMTLLPPLSFLTGYLARELFPTNTSIAIPPAVIPIAAALMVIPVLSTIVTIKENGIRPKRLDLLTPVIKYIHEHTSQTDTIFVWGQAPDLYFLSDRRPATRFIYPFPLLTSGYTDEAVVQQLMDDFSKSPPELIIDMSGENNDKGDTASDKEPTGDGLVPALSDWNPDWRHPDPRKPEFAWWGTRPSWWAISPAMKRLYDYVAERYAPVGYVGPRKWIVYRLRA
ncbi:glycosyltransferase family 39 protein [Nitrospira sp. Nam74]